MTDPTPMNDQPAPEPAPEDAPAGEPSPAAAVCRQCGADRPARGSYCPDCGLIFAGETAASAQSNVSDRLIAGRYRLVQLVSERDGVARFRGVDEGTGGNPIAVIVVRQAAESAPAAHTPEQEFGNESVFDFDLPDSPAEQATLHLPNPADPTGWPGVGWEQGVLLRAAHLSLPRLIDNFAEDGFGYLVEEVPEGSTLWDSWDREGVSNRDRFGWLIQIAEALDRLHFAGAIVEGLRPENIVISPGGVAILADLAELLPMPLPGDVPLKGGFSTAPELFLNPAQTDARADLYAFGGLLYALLLGRELSDLDFSMTGVPRSYLERDRDASPFLVRLLARTFVRDPAQRFPTQDGAHVDPTGFRELVAALGACRRNLDRARIDVAAWSTIGMVRSGNEDAVSVHHSSEARLDDTDEAALVLLADGMGGMASGEVAAALALQTLRNVLLSGPPFAGGLAPTPLPAPPPQETENEDSPEPRDGAGVVESLPLQIWITDAESPERTADAHAERVTAALREANRRVYEAAGDHQDARGMGCTAEVVLIDGPTAVVGHVGDSRVYRLRGGRLTQITRDHTTVSRLVELGQLTEEEAEVHPRRSELHQAIGGRPEVYPDVYAIALTSGDWLIVCSDGLSNQVSAPEIQEVLRDARSAERAARRLVNRALDAGALDNVTVAVARIV